MGRETVADLTMAAATLFLGASLVFSGHSLLRLHGNSGGVPSSLNFSELLGLAGAGLGILLLCCWLFGFVCACICGAAHVLGAARLAAFTAACSPAFMRRLIIAIMGLNLLAAPLAGASEGPGVDPLWHAQTVATSPALSTAQPTSAAAPPVAPQWTPQAPTIGPDLLMRPTTRQAPLPPSIGSNEPGSETPPAPGHETSNSSDVVVKSGDSLWSIVAKALGPYSNDVDVALAWPAWYRANEATIGPNPNIIHPGQILHAP